MFKIEKMDISNIKKNKIIMIINLMLILLILLLHNLLGWAKEVYGQVSLGQVYFHLLVSTEGTSNDIIKDIINSSILPSLFIFLLIVICVIIYNFKFKDKRIVFKNIQIFPFKLKDVEKLMILIVILLIVILRACYFYKAHEFILNLLTPSDFIVENYVDPSEVEIIFPNKKKNLIYIYMESMESTYVSESLGGDFEDNLIPNLYNLANENINVSNDLDFGGLYQVSGASWTIGGMVAQTAGIPLKTPIERNEYTSNYNSFLKGAYSLGDVLDKNGYNQQLFLGSDASFAGRDLYFHQHGNYEIIDYDKALEDNLIPENYHVFWGYEDEKLYNLAKDQILSLARSDKPFNFTMLTVDTHTFGGYLPESCSRKYDKQIMDVINCSDKMVYEFINWLSLQDFYEDTVIVITGDHLNMDETFFTGVNERYIFDTIINSNAISNNTKNRIATSLDMYPTTLAALGASIDGNKLGLGVNLFSTEETLGEKYGMDYVNSELSKSSRFYDENILKNK